MSVPMLEDEIVGICDEVLEMGLLIRRRQNLVLPTVTCDKSDIACDTLGMWGASTAALDNEHVAF